MSRCMWLAAFKQYQIGAAACGQAPYMVLEHHFYECLRVADEFAMACAQSYDDIAREEWARRVSIDDDSFDIKVESAKICERSLRIAKRRHNIGDGAAQPSNAAADETRKRGNGQPKTQKPVLKKLYCKHCKRDGHDEKKCWDKNEKGNGKDKGKKGKGKGRGKPHKG